MSTDGRSWRTTSTSLTADSLTNGTSYSFSVRAVNSIGEGPAATASATPVAPADVQVPTAPATPVAPPVVVQAPSAPTGVGASSVSSLTPTSAQATVTWTPGSDGGSPITGYTVRVNETGQLVNAPGTSATVTGLRPGTQYTFSVAAANAVGTSPWSAPSAVVTPPAPQAELVVKPVSRRGSLYADVNPNLRSGSWKVTVQKLTARGGWRKVGTYKTKGTSDTLKLDLKKGTYRAVVQPKYGYTGVTSGSVKLTR